MGVALAVILLGGISLITWGCTGLWRYAYERTLDARPSFAGGASAALILCALAVIAGAVTLQPVLWSTRAVASLFTAGQHGLAAQATLGAAYGWLWACGGVLILLGLRVFRRVSPIVLSGLFAAFYGGALVLLCTDLAPGRLGLPSALSTPGVGAVALGASLFGLVGVRRGESSIAAPSASEELTGDAARDDVRDGSVTENDVAAVICAYNEEDVIAICLESICKILPKENVFVGSDGSSDRTVDIVREHGCNVLDIAENGGKARTLQKTLDHFSICERFQVALILDADAEIDLDYLRSGLPHFDDPEVVAVAGHAVPRWIDQWKPTAEMFFVAYRIRLYWLTQALLRYGQTWKYSNVSFIVPGFASMYRCKALKEIDIAASGLSVEDFNMTFEVHHKRLGKIAYSPRVRGISQEAHSLGDYFRQVQRWYLGFWQTIRRHGIWASFFWLSLGVFTVEMLLQSIALLMAPIIVAWLAVTSDPYLVAWSPQVGSMRVGLHDILLIVFLADYALTLLVAVIDKKKTLPLYGLGFIFLRCIDAFLFLYTLPLAFVQKSDGKWMSPRRLSGSSESH